MSFETNTEPEFLKREIREFLSAEQAHYEPNPSTQDSVSNKIFTAVIAGIGGGKTTTTNEVLAIEPHILPINTSTTRASKPEDPSGFKTGLSFEWFRDKVGNADLINYSVIPNADIYGTLPEDFPGEFNIGPFLPSGVAQIERAGFKRLNLVYLVSPGDDYESFVNEIRPNVSEEYLKIRAKETVSSIQFAQENINKLTFVENLHEDNRAGITKVAKKICEITMHNAGSDISPTQVQAHLGEMLAVANKFAK